ncbi:MAG: bifunctional phosphoglucose/phosphomannose isomerase [Anaerolineae bacterium]|nr:bifunctional phosphoglucose/phosphomannose isomerase [Anaerolineae bacterium]
MNLDDLSYMRAVDRDAMLAHIEALPDQLENAWRLAQTLPLPETHCSPRQIVLCGMGGSAIGGSLTAALIAKTSPVPFNVVRGYDLPAYVAGPDTLVITSSHSGNTEETLSTAHQALTRDVRVLAISTGGQLADLARTNDLPLWQFDYASQPRAALGWSFGLLIGLVHRLNLAPALETDLAEAVALLREEKDRLGAANPAANNPAKRGAGQIVGRIPVIWGGGIFEPVARRWKGQLNENAKIWAQYEAMPEGNHNAVVGISFPEEALRHMAAIFITSREMDHPRVALRHDLTFKLCLQHAIGCDTFRPRGQSALAQMLHAIQYGDYLSFYAAMAYGADPTEIAPIIELKDQLAQHA